MKTRGKSLEGYQPDSNQAENSRCRRPSPNRGWRWSSWYGWLGSLEGYLQWGRERVRSLDSIRSYRRSNLFSNTIVESDEIPAEALALAKEKRRELLEQLAEVDDEIGELLIMDE